MTGGPVLVAGCGAVGSVFACLLAADGCEIHVLGRGDHLEAMADRAVRLDGIWGERSARVARAVGSAADLDRDYATIFVACKSFQTERMLAELGPRRLAAGGAAISLQNGLGNREKLAAVFGDARSLAGRVIFGAEIVAPGHVRVTVEAEPVLIGHPGGANEHAEQWAQRLVRAGIRTTATAHILAALWGKVFYNAALNPMGALLRLRYGELAADPTRREVMNRIIAEAFAVARAEGVQMSWPDTKAYLKHFHDTLLPATAAHRSSMLQDLERGRPTEIDAICGEICRRGDAAGVDVATNRLLWALLRGGD